MYITVDDIKNEISLDYPIDIRNGDKKVGLIRAYFVYSFYNVEKDERSTLRMAKHYQLKRAVTLRKTLKRFLQVKLSMTP